jgi:hypothetical protein
MITMTIIYLVRRYYKQRKLKQLQQLQPVLT